MVSTPTRKRSFLIESSLVVAHGVLFVKYASILLQAITVQIDEAFLYALMDVAKLDGIDWDADRLGSGGRSIGYDGFGRTPSKFGNEHAHFSR